MIFLTEKLSFPNSRLEPNSLSVIHKPTGEIVYVMKNERDFLIVCYMQIRDYNYCKANKKMLWSVQFIEIDYYATKIYKRLRRKNLSFQT